MDHSDTLSSDSLGAQLARMEGDRDAVESERMRLELRARMFDAAVVPAHVDRFVVLRRLGAGGMGVVYAATDPQLDREVAIKLLFEGDASEDRRARLRGEAKALAKLSHPNVVAVYEVGEHEGRVFVAMEYVRGRTLTAWASERPRSWREILAIYAQAGRGLAAAHTQGIVHRDFKPDNVLVGEDERARVLDFGLARSAAADHGLDASLRTTATSDDSGTSLTRTGARLGTPAYMAPEQFSSADVDERADQFSFCVALWEALYGARPFEGDTLESLVAAVVGGRLREPSNAATVPGWVRAVVTKGLAVAPNERWGSMSALLHALEHDPTQRRKRWILGSAAALVAAVAIAGTARLTLPASGSGSEDSERTGAADEVVVESAPPSASAEPRDDDDDLHTVQHVVLPGETIAEVAALYGCDPETLVALNELTDTEVKLTFGQAIRVPATRPVTRRLVYHETGHGETWRSLSERYDVPVDRLRLYNPELGDTLDTGRRVTVYLTIGQHRDEGSGADNSVGFTNDGSLRNGRQLPASSLYTINVPSLSWGSSTTIDALVAALTSFRAESAYAGPLVVTDISKPEGGPLPPHKSHQSGRDADVLLPVMPGVDLTSGDGHRKPRLNEVDWVAASRLIRALLETGAVQELYLDWEMQAALHRAAVIDGWDEALLTESIQWPRGMSSSKGVIRHSQGHGTAIHVRFRCGALETECMGRRTNPLRRVDATGSPTGSRARIE